MALTTCRECGVQVSTQARTCPSCGLVSPSHEEARRKAKRDVTLQVLLAVVGMVIAFAVLDYVVIPLLADG